MAVVVSEEQGEVDKFRKWDLDINPAPLCCPAICRITLC